jgi:hypothetical protein
MVPERKVLADCNAPRLGVSLGAELLVGLDEAGSVITK